MTYRSQWSLTFEVRKSAICRVARDVGQWSQWSLTFEVRKSSGDGPAAGVGGDVAMEPDL